MFACLLEDFSQSVSKLHKDWMVKRVGAKRNGEGVGAEDLNLDVLLQHNRQADGDISDIGGGVGGHGQEMQGGSIVSPDRWAPIHSCSRSRH